MLINLLPNLNFSIRKKKRGNNEQNFHCDVLHELHSLQRLVTSTCHLYSQCQMKFNNCNYWGFFCHRDNPSVHVDTLKGFPVPQWMIDKIKIQMAAQRTDTFKSKSRSRSNTPSDIRTGGQVQ